MKKSLCFLPILAMLTFPHVSGAECKKHITLADSAALKSSIGKDPASSVILDSDQKTMVAIFDKQPTSGKGKVVARFPAGQSLRMIDKKEGAFQVETVAADTKAKVTGWVDKKFSGKPIWLDTVTMQVCESTEGRMGRDGQSQKEGQKENKEKKRSAQG